VCISLFKKKKKKLLSKFCNFEVSEKHLLYVILENQYFLTFDADQSVSTERSSLTVSLLVGAYWFLDDC